MLVTILADASFCPVTKVAGYGYWIACERGKLGGDGGMRLTCDAAQTAEMKALVNALHVGIRHGLVKNGDDVLLQTDCVAAIMAFEGKRTRLTAQETATVLHFNGMIRAAGIDVKFRHVKGHSGKSEPRYTANRLCDTGAKRSMRALRDALLNTINR